jgi:hypothetical protein
MDMRTARLAALAAIVLPLSLGAQVIDLTIHDVGLAIGDKPRVTGLRINFRDRRLEQVNGINATIWSPYEPATGVVNGLALGVPVTGARVVNGALIGLIGGGTESAINGLGLGVIGVGSGGTLKGIMIGGIGVGGGGNTTGLMIGGIGAGGGGSMTGINIGGIGVGGGGDLTGINVGGIGAGGGGNIKGLSVGGIGVGGGGNIAGVTVGGLGVGGGGRVRGIAVGGVGVGAPELNGLMVGGAGVGGQNVKAIVLTAGYFKIDKQGRFDGGAIAPVSNIGGAQHGLTIGLWNYAHELHGAQIGLINVSDNDGKRRVLPLISVR